MERGLLITVYEPHELGAYKSTLNSFNMSVLTWNDSQKCKVTKSLGLPTEPKPGDSKDITIAILGRAIFLSLYNFCTTF